MRQNEEAEICQALALSPQWREFAPILDRMIEDTITDLMILDNPHANSRGQGARTALEALKSKVV
jgi:hypothetical protein